MGSGIGQKVEQKVNKSFTKPMSFYDVGEGQRVVVVGQMKLDGEKLMCLSSVKDTDVKLKKCDQCKLRVPRRWYILGYERYGNMCENCLQTTRKRIIIGRRK